MKFDRRYRLTVQYDDAGNTITVSYPLTLEFDVRRNTFSSAASAVFRIYNLNQDHRNLIYHDRTDFPHYRQVYLEAGYLSEPRLPLIYQGNILKAGSYRQGTNFITEIEAASGMFAIQNSATAPSSSFPAGYNRRIAILDLISQMNRVRVGAVGDFPNDQGQRGVCFTGNPWDNIQAIAGPGAQTYIDNEKVYVLQESEYVNTGLEFVVNASTGLLETPRKDDTIINVPILFEPRVNVGDIILLQSLEQIYNGRYSVVGVNHSGTISGAVGGRVTTLMNVWKGISALTPVNPQ